MEENNTVLEYEKREHMKMGKPEKTNFTVGLCHSILKGLEVRCSYRM
jgi:hypothetical protein